MKSRRLKNGRAETPSSREFLRDLIVGLQAFQSQRDWIIRKRHPKCRRVNADQSYRKCQRFLL
jgi:hypothetical protein